MEREYNKNNILAVIVLNLWILALNTITTIISIKQIIKYLLPENKLYIIVLLASVIIEKNKLYVVCINIGINKPFKSNTNFFSFNLENSEWVRMNVKGKKDRDVFTYSDYYDYYGFYQDAIKEVIPEQASSSNKLADKDFVNSSIATNTANFLGTYNIITAFRNAFYFN